MPATIRGTGTFCFAVSDSVSAEDAGALLAGWWEEDTRDRHDSHRQGDGHGTGGTYLPIDTRGVADDWMVPVAVRQGDVVAASGIRDLAEPAGSALVEGEMGEGEGPGRLLAKALEGAAGTIWESSCKDQVKPASGG